MPTLSKGQKKALKKPYMVINFNTGFYWFNHERCKIELERARGIKWD